ncbi:MAG: PAS domain S-box protein [Hyphomicrobiales bacterium]|nr:PAS domain S-box protein [Hyphomicrobiales bacterium]
MIRNTRDPMVVEERSDFDFLISSGLAGIAAIGDDSVVVCRAGNLSQWLPEEGRSCFESPLLCGLEEEFATRQQAASELLVLPSVFIPAGELQNRLNILFGWNVERQRFVVLTTIDAVLQPVDQWLTQQKREQRMLSEQIASANRLLAIEQQRYRDLVEESNDLICRLDENFRITFANQRMEAFFAADRETLLGRELHSWFEDRGEISPFMSGDLLVDQDSVVSVEHETTDPQGETRWFWWSLRPVAHAEGGLEIQAVGRDITDLKNLQIEISAQKELVEAVNRELLDANSGLQQFASAAAHDLQAPLRQVKMFAQLLQQDFADELSEGARDYAVLIESGVARMQRLIRSFLDYARLSATAASFSPVALNTAAAEAIATLKPMIEELNAEITVADLPEVIGDQLLLTQVFQNLIGNALKYRDEAVPCIRITARRGETGHEIVVTDNGIGIAPEFAERVFQVFSRLHGEDVYEGSGVGLAVCRRIIEMHRGRIWVEQRPGPGVNFVFSLPRRD